MTVLNRAAKLYRRKRRFARALFSRWTMLTLFHHPMFASCRFVRLAFGEYGEELALIEEKPNALDQAAALQGWDLPESFQHLRHLLEARMGNRGKREFIQVLRLMEALPREVVSFAVGEAIRLGAIGFDAVKLIALARLERRPARLNLAAYPHLPKTMVKTTSAADYAVLLPGAAA